MSKIFDTQARAVLARFDEIGTSNPDALFSPAEWDEPLRDAVGEAVRACALEGAVAQAEAFAGQHERAAAWWAKAKRDDRLGDEAQAGVDAYADEVRNAPWLSDINDTTKDAILNAVRRGIENDEPPEKIAKRIKRAMKGIEGDRALMIARTEATGAINAGQTAVAHELAGQGLPVLKEWLAIRDGRTRPEHAKADGQQVEAKDLFAIGDEQCRYPGDPALSPGQRINCRCGSMNVIKE